MKKSTSILTFVMFVFLTHVCDAGVGYRTKISKYSTWCEDNISVDKESFKGLNNVNCDYKPMDDVKDNPTPKDRKETTKYPADRTESMIGSDSIQVHSGALDDYLKDFAEKALENRIFIRRVADLEGRGLTEEDRRIDSINVYLVKSAMSRVTDSKVITGYPKWEELANEFVRYDNIVKSIESKKQNGSSSKWSLIKKAEASELPQDSAAASKQEKVKVASDSELIATSTDTSKTTTGKVQVKHRTASEENSDSLSSTDVKKTLEEFHAKFLSQPNSRFKWQQIQAYLDLVVSLQSWTLPSEKVLNQLVQEGSVIRTRNNTWKDLVEVSFIGGDSKSCWPNEKVGISGWCRCQRPRVTKRDSEWMIVGSQIARVFDGQRELADAVGLLSFRVCKKCGKCYTYRSLGEGYDDLIHGDTDFHVYPYSETVDVYISQTVKRTAALMKMEDAILTIPDGEIVVPIKKECSCKRSPDERLNIVAFYERQANEKAPRRYVCVDCFGLYSPKGVRTHSDK